MLERTEISEYDASKLAAGGGETVLKNRWLILSYFKDVYQAENIELRAGIED